MLETETEPVQIVVSYADPRPSLLATPPPSTNAKFVLDAVEPNDTYNGVIPIFWMKRFFLDVFAESAVPFEVKGFDKLLILLLVIGVDEPELPLRLVISPGLVRYTALAYNGRLTSFAMGIHENVSAILGL